VQGFDHRFDFVVVEHATRMKRQPRVGLVVPPTRILVHGLVFFARTRQQRHVKLVVLVGEEGEKEGGQEGCGGEILVVVREVG
jgi:hypothetical protein